MSQPFSRSHRSQGLQPFQTTLDRDHLQQLIAGRAISLPDVVRRKPGLLAQLLGIKSPIEQLQEETFLQQSRVAARHGTRMLELACQALYDEAEVKVNAWLALTKQATLADSSQQIFQNLHALKLQLERVAEGFERFFQEKRTRLTASTSTFAKLQLDSLAAEELMVFNAMVDIQENFIETMRKKVEVQR